MNEETTQGSTVVTRSAAKPVRQLNPKIQLAKDAVVLRVIDEQFGPSKTSGKNMITLEVEIAHPSMGSDMQGNLLEIGGYKFKAYFPVENDDPKVQANQRENLFELWAKIGEPMESFDAANPPLFFKKAIDDNKPILLDAVIYGKKNIAMNPATKKPILMGGKEIIDYQVQIDSIYGISNTEPTVAF